MSTGVIGVDKALGVRDGGGGGHIQLCCIIVSKIYMYIQDRCRKNAQTAMHGQGHSYGAILAILFVTCCRANYQGYLGNYCYLSMYVCTFAI